MKRQLATGVILIAPLSGTEVSVSWNLPPEMAKRRQGIPAAQFLFELNSALNTPPSAYPTYQLPFHLPLFQELVSTREIRPLEYRESVEYARPGIALVGLAAHSLDSLFGAGINMHLCTAINLAHSLCQDVELGKPLGAGLEQYSKKSRLMMQIAKTWEESVKCLGTDATLTNVSRGLSMATVRTLFPQGLGEYMIREQMNGWQTVPST
jgi:2-octaprenyl-3-methyl-6-methoxy-1,4-benzoquinol hydroxylase